MTLKSFYDTLKSQAWQMETLQKDLGERAAAAEARAAAAEGEASALAQRVARLEKALNDKVDRKDVVSEVSRRVTRAEHALKASHHEAKGHLQTSIDRLESDVAAELKSVKATMRAKVSVDRFKSEIESRVTLAEIGELIDAKCDRAVMQKSMERVRQAVMSELGKKADRSRLEDLAKKVDGKVAELTEATTTTLKHVASSKADAKSVRLFREVLGEELQAIRQEQHEMESRMDADSHTNAAAFKTLTQGLENHIGQLQSLADEQSYNVASLREFCEQRVAASQGQVESLRASIQGKVDADDMDSMLGAKADVEDIMHRVDRHLELKASAETVNEIAETVARLQMRSSLRGGEDPLGGASLEDICAVLDHKVDVADMNRVLAGVQADVARKIDRSLFDRAVRDQSVINAALCAESGVARFVWKGGRPRPGSASAEGASSARDPHLVPWTSQSLNTDPGNFVWAKEKAWFVVSAYEWAAKTPD